MSENIKGLSKDKYGFCVESRCMDAVNEEKENKKPDPKDYGWYERQGFDDDESGWTIEGGEDAYYEALKNWENQENKDNQEITKAKELEEIYDLLKSESVYTALRFAVKSPTRSGVEDCEDHGYYDLYRICCKLRG